VNLAQSWPNSSNGLPPHLFKIDGARKPAVGVDQPVPEPSRVDGARRFAANRWQVLRAHCAARCSSGLRSPRARAALVGPQPGAHVLDRIDHGLAQARSRRVRKARTTARFLLMHQARKLPRFPPDGLDQASGSPASSRGRREGIGLECRESPRIERPSISGKLTVDTRTTCGTRTPRSSNWTHHGAASGRTRPAGTNAYTR